MLWLKAFHVVFVVTWFAGLFYLPRLFVYHVATADAPGRARFIVMERRLFFIMSLGAAARRALRHRHDRRGARRTWGSAGCGRNCCWWPPWSATTPGATSCCWRCAPGATRHSQRWYRLFNEVPALLLIAIVVLAVVKP